MNWFKSILLVGTMVLVAWGVWRTLTAQPTPTDPPHTAAGPAPAFDGGSHTSGAGSFKGPPSITMPDPAGSASSDAFPGGLDSTARSSQYTPPDLPKEVVREKPGPRFGGAASGAAPPSAAPPSAAPPGAAPPGAPPLSAAPSRDTLESRRLQNQFDTAVKRVKSLMDQQKYKVALEELSNWYPRRDDLEDGRAPQMLSYLDLLAGKVIYSNEHHLAPAYKVGQADTLAELATLFSVPGELLAKINGVSPSNLRTNQPLKVVHGPFHVDVRLSKFEITMLLGSKQLYAGRFRIGVGSQVPLTEGTYVVTKKYLKPEYYPDPNDGRRYVPGGDPENPLGEKMVEFETPDKKSFGALHGTNNAATVGKSCPEGCLRLTPQEINDVFDMLTIGQSRVRVRQ